ncbi:SGNH/GDSL hydrolase family protein [Nocardioides pantholopis]|uniref:SGNH/GDSL hydrolase family protein n=1 Tax=Nocardioides pantholopis TaxID=2483798 RepID=UPI0013DE0F66|nr:SGNH/GDSL hydrolase family protein [Nocardioides pantholopis]
MTERTVPLRRRPRSARAGLAGLLCLAGLLTGCSDDDGPTRAELASPSASPTETPAAPVQPPPSAAARFPTYVALGDSYTAAPLISEPIDTVGCLRSAGNYPARVAETLGAQLEDRSCTGADTSNLTGPQRTLTGSVPAQLDAVRAGTSLVTVGIGGNDFGLFSTLVGCLEAGADDGESCQDRVDVDQVRTQLDEVTVRVGRVLEEVGRRAPDAEVVVIGYPQIVPPDRTCPDRLPLAEDDHLFLADLNTRLDRAVQQAARTAGVAFADVYAASDAHDRCSAQPWVSGSESATGEALAHHPLAAEQEAVAGLVVEALSE